MKHFLIGAVFVLVLVGIVPAFAQMSMDMSSMGGMTMPMPSPSPSPMPMNSTDMMSQIMPCTHLGGQMMTASACGAAWDAAQRSSAPPPAPSPAPVPTPPPPPPPPPPTLTPPPPPPPPAEIPKEDAPEENDEDRQLIENIELELELKAEQAALAKKLAALAKQIDSGTIAPLLKSLSRVKGRNTKKLIKSAAKAIEKSLTKGREKSCAEYPTEVFALKCELLFTNALQAVKLASMKKNASPADFTKALEELRSSLKDISAE